MKKCVFAGTFDPPTVGHKTVVEESLKIFDEVIVAVLDNRQKETCLSKEERVRLLKKLFEGENKVRVMYFDGAVVDLLEQEQTPFYVRGVRDCIDVEYENRNFYANKELKPDIVTIYLPAGREELHVSSTIVRNCIAFKKDYSEYIPSEILSDFNKILENKRKCSKNK